MNTSVKESLKIVTADGFVLSATRFNPKQSNGKVMLINSATGVKQRYYSDYALSLADEGFIVYTYDYRGIGESRSGSLRDLKVSMKDWGSKDYHAMLHNIFQTHHTAKVVVMGHSIGGQMVGFSPLSSKVEAFVMVAAQTPFIQHYPGFANKIKLYFFWYFLIPVFTRLFGYFPASKLGLFEDLPANVAYQWARWAKSKNYVFDEFPEDESKFHSLQSPALMVGFSDDSIAPPLAVRDLMKHYTQMKWSYWEVKPEDIMQRSIGHFGFFRKHVKATLWAETSLWISKVLQPGSRKAA